MKHDKNYERLGYAIYRNALPNKITQEIQNHVEFLSNLYPRTRPEAFHHDILVEDPFIHHILNQDCINEISKHYLGSDFALFGAHYIAKKPHDGKPVGWHQDGSYWPLKPMDVISNASSYLADIRGNRWARATGGGKGTNNFSSLFE